MVKEDITCGSIDTEHPDYISIPFDVERIIAGKGIGVFISCGARQSTVKISLGYRWCIFSRDSDFSRI